MNEPPKNVPGIFYFVQEFGGEKYEAFMQPELAKKYDELKINAEARDLILSNALDISLRISPEALERLVSFNRHILLLMSHEDSLEEFGESLSLESKEGLIFMMQECCKVVLNFQKALGHELSALIQKPSTNANADGENKSPSSIDAKALKALEKRFTRALEILSKSRKPKRHPLAVMVELNDGKKERVLLTVRAIEVALELATRLQRCPSRKELIEELVTRHHQELISDRDKKNRSDINWSEQLEAAGLKKLPSV